MFGRFTFLIPFAIAWAWFGAGQTVEGQDFLNSTWRTKYTTAKGDEVDCKVTLISTEEDEERANGSYLSSVDGEPVGKGSLSKVRIGSGKRDESPLPGPGQGSLGGLPDGETLYLKGLWKFGNQKGWLKWELYENGGKCRFVGTWGYLEDGEQGRTRGQWTGTLITEDDQEGENGEDGEEEDEEEEEEEDVEIE
ncbi:MAG: hypothetical protein WD851_03480 [Pirellulales bacterium]